MTIGPGFGQPQQSSSKPTSKLARRAFGEIAKSFGINVKKADGSRLQLDDPELDPIWETAARLNIPVFIHTADPQEFFEPIDYTNERWLELALYPRSPISGRRRFRRFETLMAERDRLFKKHPKTTFVRRTSAGTPTTWRAWEDVRRDAERVRRGRRGALRHRPAAAVCARLLRQVSGPDSVRQRQLPARRISRTTGVSSKRATSTSTTTATTTRSGSCTASRCQTMF